MTHVPPPHMTHVSSSSYDISSSSYDTCILLLMSRATEVLDANRALLGEVGFGGGKPTSYMDDLGALRSLPENWLYGIDGDVQVVCCLRLLIINVFSTPLGDGTDGDVQVVGATNKGITVRLSGVPKP